MSGVIRKRIFYYLGKLVGVDKSSEVQGSEYSFDLVDFVDLLSLMHKSFLLPKDRLLVKKARILEYRVIWEITGFPEWRRRTKLRLWLVNTAVVFAKWLERTFSGCSCWHILLILCLSSLLLHSGGVLDHRRQGLLLQARMVKRSDNKARLDSLVLRLVALEGSHLELNILAGHTWALVALFALHGTWTTSAFCDWSSSSRTLDRGSRSASRLLRLGATASDVRDHAWIWFMLHFDGTLFPALCLRV